MSSNPFKKDYLQDYSSLSPPIGDLYHINEVNQIYENNSRIETVDNSNTFINSNSQQYMTKEAQLGYNDDSDISTIGSDIEYMNDLHNIDEDEYENEENDDEEEQNNKEKDIKNEINEESLIKNKEISLNSYWNISKAIKYLIDGDTEKTKNENINENEVKEIHKESNKIYIEEMKRKLTPLQISSPKIFRINSFSTPRSATNSNLSQLKKKKIKYRVTFPPGSMGLELEPIIRSKDVELGCRVKNYYFR